MALATSRLLKIPFGDQNIGQPWENITEINSSVVLPSPATFSLSSDDGVPNVDATLPKSEANCAEANQENCNRNILTSDEYLEFLVSSIGDVLGKIIKRLRRWVNAVLCTSYGIFSPGGYSLVDGVRGCSKV